MRKHVPVLFEEVIEAMPQWAKAVFDGTLWHAGHTVGMAKELLKQWTTEFVIVWADRDALMIEKAKHTMDESQIDPKHFKIVQCSYAELEKVVEESWVERFDYILLDIWVNMDHFKEADRGFSIKLDGDLDMRFDTSQWIPVSEWLAKANYQELYDAFELYADFSSKYTDIITKELMAWKWRSPLLTTKDVKEWASHAGINDKKLAVIFQTWRIVINNELGELDSVLQKFTQFLHQGWICAVISYHSWEDRRVKNVFKRLHDQWEWTNLTKKVIKPNRKEVKRNKAARSAKMRLFQLL